MHWRFLQNALLQGAVFTQLLYCMFAGVLYVGDNISGCKASYDELNVCDPGKVINDLS